MEWNMEMEFSFEGKREVKWYPLPFFSTNQKEEMGDLQVMDRTFGLFRQGQ